MTGGAGAAVRCRRVTHLYQRQDEQVVALRDVDLDVRPGEALALLGPSGSGKSTLLSLLAGLQRPASGQILIDDTDLGGSDRGVGRRLRAGSVGLLLQEPGRALLPYLTPVQMLGVAGDLRALDTLVAYGLAGTARQRVATLSAGQQQRLALAVVMAGRPRLLLADEPTSRLDAEARDELLSSLHRAAHESGTTVMAVTHDPAVARGFPRTLTMRDGRVGSEGHHGEDLPLVGPDGSLPLPEQALAVLPPATRVRVEVDGDTVTLRPGPDRDAPWP